MAKVIIKFENDEQAKGFADWLNNQGEQDYWTFAECSDDLEYVDTFEYGAMKKGTITIEGTNS